MEKIDINVPEELKKLKQWVLYKMEERDGGFTKPPYQLNGRYASTIEPSTWATYEEVVAKYQSSGKYDGIGFVFTAEDEYIGIDLDDVVDPKSGVITPEARNIVDYIGSYTEISPSGKGIHIIALKDEQAIEDGRTSTADIKSLEMYSSKRYFTMTGNVYDGMKEINYLPETIVNVDDLKRKGELVYICDIEQSEQFKRNKDDEAINKIIDELQKNDRFKTLFNGQYELLYKSQSNADMALCRIIANRKRNPEIIDSIFRRSGLYRPKWDFRRTRDGKTYGELTINKLLTSLKKREEAKKLNKSKIIMEQKEEENEIRDKYLMNSEWEVKNNLVDIIGKNLKYNAKEGWYLYNSQAGKWENKRDNEIGDYIANTINSIISQIYGRDNGMYTRLLSGKAIKAVMELYKGDNRIIINTETMNPSYLRLKNGYINLENGNIEKGYKTYDTREIDINYSPNAKAPRWAKFILECMNGNREKAAFIKRAIGYAFTGHTREQVLFFCIGPGANGKSVFKNVLTAIAGSGFARQMPSDSLAAGKYYGKEYDMAHIYGARLVFANELNSNFQLDEAKIKMLTGEDKITARHLYEDYFEYRPECKIFFISNVMPTIKSTNEGMWRRVIILPFDKVIKTENRDKELERKLFAEREGILKWIIEGAMEWHKEMLQPPKSIIEEANKYRIKEDVIYRYIDERIQHEEQSYEFTKELYKDFTEWVKEKEIKTRINSQTMLTMAFSEKGYERIQKRDEKKSNLHAIQGIKIKNRE